MSAIKVVDYDPAWPALFAAQKLRILELTGDLLDEIHHVGSTSIAGLAAKPKIDIDAVLRLEKDIPEAVERVKALGDYTSHGDR